MSEYFWKIDKEKCGVRLDHFLTEQKLPLSRSQIQKLCEQHAVQVNKLDAKSSYRLKEKDEICLKIPPARPLDALPEAIPLEILYEDDAIAVINKPAELVVHVAAGHSSGTLVHALLYHLKDLSDIGGVLRPGIVHRLDKGTSGLMIVAKNNKSHQELVRQFQNREIQKTYLTVAYGTFPFLSGTFSSALGRSRGNRKKISSKTTFGREAFTDYKVLEQLDHVALVEVHPKTGRTHQIRVHLVESGHPVMGDPLYGGKQWLARFKPEVKEQIEKLDHQLLHAWKLNLKHPISQKELFFQVNPPVDFQEMLQKLQFKPLPESF